MKMGSSHSILQGSINPYKPTFVHRLFEERVNKNPNEVALIFEDTNGTKSHSYTEFNNITNKIARSIIATITNCNASPNNDGDYIVAVSMQPSDNLIMALMAIWKSGAAYLPIDPTFPKNRVEHILDEAKPTLVIYEKDFDFTTEIISKKFNDLFEESQDFCVDTIREENSLKHEKENIAIVLYTSGSTGVPKGVRLPHEVILNRLFWQLRTMPYFAYEKIGVFKTNLTCVDSVVEILGPLLNGLSLLIIPRKVIQDPDSLILCLRKYQIQRIVLVPSLLQSLLYQLSCQKNKKLLWMLKIWVCSGEPLTVSLAQEFFKYFPENEYKLYNFYGSTEVMADVTYYAISGLNQLKNQVKMPIGQPIDNTIIYLLDNNLKPVEKGYVGELYVSGLNLAAGYVNGRDSEKFINNPHQTINSHFGKLYKTGDYAKIENGTLVFEGRIDNQVKIRGYRVDFSEVEKAVNSLSVIETGVVLCYHPGDMDQALLSFITLKNESRFNEMQIEEMIQKKLTCYMWPQVIIVESIPLLVNGKIDRQSLLKSYENNKTNGTEYTGITDQQMPAAKVLLETVASVLGRSARSSITIHANFYEIGGNSLNSILTISKLNEQGYNISIADFISADDLREILNHMSPEEQILPAKATTRRYTFEMLNDGYKDEVFRILGDSFYEKGDLETWLKPGMHRGDYDAYLSKVWDVLIEQDLSFVAKTLSGRTVGVALNFDGRDPVVVTDTKIDVLSDFQKYTERAAIAERIHGKGKIFYFSMNATDTTLSSKENIYVMQYIEEEALRIAKNKKFVEIYTVNTSPLTQQLAKINGYQEISDIQVNNFIASDGTKPFADAPDSQRAIVCWKTL